MDGGGGADTIGGAGGSSLGSAFAGDMTIEGGPGADTLTGWTGSDTASYEGSKAVTVNLQTGATSGGVAAGDTLTSIENLTGSANGDTLTGDSTYPLQTVHRRYTPSECIGIEKRVVSGDPDYLNLAALGCPRLDEPSRSMAYNAAATVRPAVSDRVSR